MNQTRAPAGGSASGCRSLPKAAQPPALGHRQPSPDAVGLAQAGLEGNSSTRWLELALPAKGGLAFAKGPAARSAYGASITTATTAVSCALVRSRRNTCDLLIGIYQQFGEDIQRDIPWKV